MKNPGRTTAITCFAALLAVTHLLNFGIWWSLAVFIAADLAVLAVWMSSPRSQGVRPAEEVEAEPVEEQAVAS